MSQLEDQSHFGRLQQTGADRPASFPPNQHQVGTFGSGARRVPHSDRWGGLILSSLSLFQRYGVRSQSCLCTFNAGKKSGRGELTLNSATEKLVNQHQPL